MAADHEPFALGDHGLGISWHKRKDGKLVVEIIVDQNEVLKKALPMLLEQAVKGAGVPAATTPGLKKDGTPKKKRESKKADAPPAASSTPLFTQEPAGAAKE